MPPSRNSNKRYGKVAMLLHWLMALLIIGLISVGLYMTSMPAGPDKLKIYGLHKSLGALVLGLFLLRLLWRFISPPPPLPLSIPAFQASIAGFNHFLLYLFMFIMPVSGWLMSSAAGFPVSFFGLFNLPDLIEPNRELRILFREIHGIAAYGLIALIGLHVAAALFHHFIKRDNVLRRMLP